MPPADGRSLTGDMRKGFYMKKRSNAGEDSELLMQLQFQPINSDMEYKDCQKIEIQGFKGEQQHQVPHDQEGVRSDCSDYIWTPLWFSG